jgi:hypothetical protein
MVLTFPADVGTMLVEAAEKRSLPIEQLVAEIVSGIIVRGSIDGALANFGDFLVDHRVEMIQPSSRRRKRKAERDLEMAHEKLRASEGNGP